MKHFKIVENPTALDLRCLDGYETLGGLAERLRKEWPWYYVYQGGSHVAMHPWDGNPNRILLITEKKL